MPTCRIISQLSRKVPFKIDRGGSLRWLGEPMLRTEPSLPEIHPAFDGRMSDHTRHGCTEPNGALHLWDECVFSLLHPPGLQLRCIHTHRERHIGIGFAFHPSLLHHAIRTRPAPAIPLALFDRDHGRRDGNMRIHLSCRHQQDGTAPPPRCNRRSASTRATGLPLSGRPITWAISSTSPVGSSSWVTRSRSTGNSSRRRAASTNPATGAVPLICTSMCGSVSHCVTNRS